MVVVIVLLVGCRGGIDAEAMLDPASCAGCHPDAYREWAGSMHAYAMDDPVFVAMNRLGQRQTNGQLGSFCLGCHAPVATALGAIADPAELGDVPRPLRGVTCVACHQIAEVTALHNGGLTWEFDTTVRGAIADPIETHAHESMASPLLDGRTHQSAGACGACHDVDVGGVAIERTYAEWSDSVFASDVGTLSCAGCHMPGRSGVAARGERTRRIHDHSMPGIDVALTPWPFVDEQRALITRDLSGVLAAKLCAAPTGGGIAFTVTLDNVLGGHAFPSGVTHARRAWVELRAEEAGVVSFETGAFGATDRVPLDDPLVWALGTRFLGATGTEVDWAWQTAAVDSQLLSPAVTRDPTDPRFYHSVSRTFVILGAPDRVQLAVHVQPVARETLDKLVAAGELDPAVRGAGTMFTLEGTQREWQRARDGFGCAP